MQIFARDNEYCVYDPLGLCAGLDPQKVLEALRYPESSSDRVRPRPGGICSLMVLERRVIGSGSPRADWAQSSRWRRTRIVGIFPANICFLALLATEDLGSTFEQVTSEFAALVLGYPDSE